MEKPLQSLILFFYEQNYTHPGNMCPAVLVLVGTCASSYQPAITIIQTILFIFQPPQPYSVKLQLPLLNSVS